MELFGAEAIGLAGLWPTGGGVAEGVVAVSRHRRLGCIGELQHVAAPVVVVIEVAVRRAARQQTADVALARVAGRDGIVGIALLQHEHPAVDVARLALRLPRAIVPGVFPRDSLAAQAVVDELALVLVASPLTIQLLNCSNSSPPMSMHKKS